MPLYTISFVVWRKRWNGRKCCQPLETELAQHYSRLCDTRDIWNVDETRLFWKGVPNCSLVLQKEKCKAGKLAKERLTIVFLCSITGEKFKPLVIGKS